jgi:hypothetical protein
MAEAVESTETPAAEAEPRRSSQQQDRQNDRTMLVLTGGFLLWMFGAQLTGPGKTEMVLRMFNNDTIAASKLVGALSSLSAVIGMFGNPVIGSLSDSLGRKPALLDEGGAGAVIRLTPPRVK